MLRLAILFLFAALAVQLPTGVLVYLDAKRLGLKDPEVYWLGVIVPVGGFVVILYYLLRRRDLPRKE